MDFNGDGIFTISDVWTIIVRVLTPIWDVFKEVFFFAGNMVISLLFEHLSFIVKFFELRHQDSYWYYDTAIAGGISLFIYYWIAMIIADALDVLERGHR